MPKPNLGLLRDKIIASDVASALGNGQSLSHRWLLITLLDAASGGITDAELQSLRQVATWIDNGTITASAYDAYIFDALVNGNPANVHWTGGLAYYYALGDLKVSPSSAQANALIAKWFLGLDHPSTTGLDAKTTYAGTSNPLFGTYAAPSYLDINQGALGDCYLLASLGAISLLEPGVIQSMITDSHDGTYGIRFLDDNGARRYVTVDNQLPNFIEKKNWENGSTLAFANGPFTWAPLIEKAYAQVNDQGILPRTSGNAYGLIAGGWGEAITEITGKAISYVAPTWQAILDGWKANEEIMVATKDKTGGSFLPDHMFVVINVDPQTQRVQLYNPWGATAIDSTRAMIFWATPDDLTANSDTLIIAQGTTQAALTTATSTGFAMNLTDSHFAFANGHETMTGANGTTVDLTAMRLINFADGTVSKFSGSPLVDDLYYDVSNHDVWNAKIAPTSHYNQYGWHEGRAPNALFSTNGYLAANADVARAGMNPLAHYDQYGFKEGRDPSAGFDNELYLARNPDVKAAGLDPLAHYLQYGQAEGRQVYTAIGKAGDFTHGSFDAEFYLLANPDVAKAALTAGGDTFAFAYQHFETYGWREGRMPDAIFDPAYYLAHNPDVAAVGMDPLAHYDQYGWKEGRDPSASFHTNAYLAANADVVAAHLDPLMHYLQYGAVEGRHLA